MATSQKHLLQPTVARNPVLAARQKYDQGTLPTLLEIRAGSPGMLKAISAEAAALKSFAERAKNTITSIGSVHFRAMDDISLTEGARLLRSAEHAETRIKDARKEFGRVAEKAIDRLKSMNNELKTAVRPPSNVGEALIDSELRALIRAEPDAAKQLSMIRTNPDMRAAAARAPAVSSGLHAGVHASIQDEQMQAVLPELHEEFTDLKAAFETANTAISAIEKQAAELIDFQTAQELAGRKFVAAEV